MPKSILMCLWTLVVAAIAFSAGRWIAFTDQPANQMETGFSINTEQVQLSPVNTSQNTNQSTALAASQTLGVQKTSSATAGHSRSYASDYQQMQLLIALAATNPQSAMEQAQQLKGAIKAKAQAAILDIWAASDAYGAWNWVQSFQPDNNEQFIRLLEVIGRNDPRTGVTFTEKFAASHRELRKDIYQSLLSGLTQAGAYTAAAQWLERVELEPGIKHELMDYVAGAWADYEPQAAMKWAMSQPDEIRIATAGRLSASWANNDPQEATHYAATITGVERDPVLQQSFSKWLEADAPAATAWLTAAPNQKDLDPLIAEVANSQGASNGQVKIALSWAGRVQDPELRLNTVTSILSAFKQKDPDSAASYLHELSFLTDAERSRLAEDLVLDK